MEKSYIKIEEFYEFLCSKPLDNLNYIRKMFMYYRNFIRSYQFIVFQFDDEFVPTGDEWNKGWTDRAFI